jgi:hypothetical protein
MRPGVPVESAPVTSYLHIPAAKRAEYAAAQGFAALPRQLRDLEWAMEVLLRSAGSFGANGLPTTESSAGRRLTIGEGQATAGGGNVALILAIKNAYSAMLTELERSRPEEIDPTKLLKQIAAMTFAVQEATEMAKIEAWAPTAPRAERRGVPHADTRQGTQKATTLLESLGQHHMPERLSSTADPGSEYTHHQASLSLYIKDLVRGGIRRESPPASGPSGSTIKLSQGGGSRLFKNASSFFKTHSRSSSATISETTLTPETFTTVRVDKETPEHRSLRLEREAAMAALQPIFAASSLPSPSTTPMTPDEIQPTPVEKALTKVEELEQTRRPPSPDLDSPRSQTRCLPTLRAPSCLPHLQEVRDALRHLLHPARHQH